MIAHAGENAYIGLGYAHSGYPETRHVGWDAGSFGLHGDDGKTFWERTFGSDYGFTYGTGDVVGAALDFQRMQIFFTPGAVLSVNFGLNPFVFDIEPYKYGFKYGTGDVVGAALDFQRMQIFFTKNGCPGRALPVNFKHPLYPTISLQSPGAVVSVNFGQSPFVFDIEPYKIKVGSRVAIRYVSIDEAQLIQANHGGWDPSMETMLGKTGNVVEVLENGDASVKLDDGGVTKHWSPSLLVPAGAPTVMYPPSARSSLRLGRNVDVDEQYIVRYIDIEFKEEVVRCWRACFKYGFTYGTGDVVGAALDFQRMQIFFTKNGCRGRALPFNFKHPLYPTISLQSPGAVVSVNFGQSPFVFDIEPYKIKVGSRVAIRRDVSIDDARSIQEKRGEWDPSMETMLGKTGKVVAVLENGYASVQLDRVGGVTKRWSPVLLAPA
ncbi:hypothetical protein PLESTF_000517600 [Pleodorina starrii]|nr:hypothetical protein PLESTF_000517600 [Pleodorina starrii]